MKAFSFNFIWTALLKKTWSLPCTAKRACCTLEQFCCLFFQILTQYHRYAGSSGNIKKPRKYFFQRKGLYLWDFAAEDIGKPSGDERQAIWKCDSLFILKSLQWIRFSYFRMNIKSIFIFTFFFATETSLWALEFLSSLKLFKDMQVLYELNGSKTFQWKVYYEQKLCIKFILRKR